MIVHTQGGLAQGVAQRRPIRPGPKPDRTGMRSGQPATPVGTAPARTTTANHKESGSGQGSSTRQPGTEKTEGGQAVRRDGVGFHPSAGAGDAAGAQGKAAHDMNRSRVIGAGPPIVGGMKPFLGRRGDGRMRQADGNTDPGACKPRNTAGSAQDTARH